MKKIRSSEFKDKIVNFIVFILPLLVVLVLLYGMLIWTFYVSFSDWYGTAPNYKFVGLKWYKLMASMDRFWVDVKNNLKWLFLGVVPTLFIALLLAYLLEISRFKRIEMYVRTLILYPAAMSFIVTGTIWSWMYQPDKGVLNTILRAVGLGSFAGAYTTNPSTATYWLILIFIWQYLGIAVIILQSSFRTTELQEMIESALVDGASKMRILFQIIVPNIRGGLLILGCLLLISALKVFDILFVTTKGGPGIATESLTYYIFNLTLARRTIGISCAAAIISVFMLFAFFLIYLKFKPEE